MKTILSMASVLVLSTAVSADWTDSLDTGAINTNTQMNSNISQQGTSQTNTRFNQQGNSQTVLNGDAEGEIEFQIELKGKLRSNIDTQAASSMESEQNTVVSGSAMTDAYPGASIAASGQNESSQNRINSGNNNWIPWHANAGTNAKSWNIPWHNDAQTQSWSPWNWTNKGTQPVSR